MTSRRSESNTLFRTHRLSMMESEAHVLHDILASVTPTPTPTPTFNPPPPPPGQTSPILQPRSLARRLLTRLLICSGGSTTTISNTIHATNHKITDSIQTIPSSSSNGISPILPDNTSKYEFQQQLVNAVWYSFGLKTILQRMSDQPAQDQNNDSTITTTILKRNDCNRILASVGLQGGIVKEDGRMIDFAKIFATSLGGGKSQRKQRQQKKRPMDMELGAGFGEWIVHQALSNPLRDYVAVELRADRVGQIFFKTTLCGISNTNHDQLCALENLCLVGADSGTFLRSHVPPESISTIFVNHPEPPTQTFGENDETLQAIMNGGEEPSHMLHSSILLAAIHCLIPEGKMIIVTDNRNYGRLICATMVKVFRQNKGSLGCIMDLNDEMKVVETFPVNDDQVSIKKKLSVTGSSSSSSPAPAPAPAPASNDVVLWEGHPGPKIGHAPLTTESSNTVTGRSYFDRLWRTGAGKHAERHLRFIIAVTKIKNL